MSMLDIQIMVKSSAIDFFQILCVPSEILGNGHANSFRKDG